MYCTSDNVELATYREKRMKRERKSTEKHWTEEQTVVMLNNEEVMQAHYILLAVLCSNIEKKGDTDSVGPTLGVPPVMFD